MSIFLLAFISLGTFSLFTSLFFFSFILLIHRKSSPSIDHGPPSYPVIGCLISFYKNRQRLLDWYTDLLSKSPTQTIVVHRLGARRIVVTANPANVEYMLKTNFNNFPKGTPFTDILGDLLGYGIFNVDGELWFTQRKLASHEFSTKSLREFVFKTLEEEVDCRLIPLLEEAAERNEILDLQEILRRFAFETICKVSLGTDPCCLDLHCPVLPLVKAFDTASEISAMRSMAPVFWFWKIKRALNVGSEKKLKEAVRLVHGSVAEIIRNKRRILEEARENKRESSTDLLSRLLQAGHVDEEVTRDMMISFIMAGRDTTSSAMTWLFWLLSKYPNQKALIVNEVNSVLANINGGSETEKPLDFETLKEMKFVKACLCESMRLYPPVAWDSKHALEDDTFPDGTPIGKGDRVTYFPYGMGRMEKLWGNDRFEFKPDRWFDEQPDGKLKTDISPYKFPVFQAGPRVCLGKEMAFIEMSYAVARILRRFEIWPVCEDRPIFVPLLTGHMAGGFKVMVRKSNVQAVVT